MSSPIVRIKDIQMIPISNLVRHPKNPNIHTPDQIERLAEIIEFQGWRYPIKVSTKSGFVTSGHGRMDAAELRGWKDVPVSFQDYENEAQEYADIVSDNAIAEWSDLDLAMINTDIIELGPDFDIDMLGIKDFSLTGIEALEPGCDEDEVPEDVDTVCKPGDLWELGKHRLFCGDALNVQHVSTLMSGALANMVFTDPPYNVALGMETPAQAKARNRRTDGLVVMNDKMSDDKFRQFLTDALSSMAISTHPGGGIYIAHSDSEGYNFRGAARDSGWLIKQCLIWNKNALVMGRQDYQWKHEPILYGWKDGGSHKWYSDRKQTTVIDFEKPSRSELHPTMKPVGLVEYFILNSSKAGDIVLDLFGGSGTTMIASEKLRRQARLMELDPKYCDVILARWEKYTGQKAKLQNGQLPPDKPRKAKPKAKKKPQAKNRKRVSC